MGIPYFVASLIRAHRGIVRGLRSPHSVDALLVDFNCFLHRYLDDHDPIPSILRALRDLKVLVQARRVYLALDGLAPYAKQVQQRYRRMRKSELKEFDRHQLSPETPWMKAVAKAVREEFPEWELSATDEPGEGEHKLFQWLRKNPQQSVLIYGLDADLVLLALAQKDLAANLHLLREKNEFQNMLSKEAEWGLLDIHGLARALPIPVDDFVELAVTCWGNDFLPPLAMFSLREDGYGRALQFKGPCKKAAEIETDLLQKRILARNRPEEMALLGKNLERRFAVHLMDGVEDWEPVVYAYWKTVAWTLHYFRTNEVLDWSWAYPYPEAPLVQTLMKYPRPTEFTWKSGIPFHVTHQLQFILPERSLRTAHRRVRFPDEIYEEESADMRIPWMRRYAWESKPRISLPWHPITAQTEAVLLRTERPPLDGQTSESHAVLLHSS